MTCIGILGISVTGGGGVTSCFGEVSNALGDKWAFSCHISIQLGRGVLIKVNWGQEITENAGIFRTKGIFQFVLGSWLAAASTPITNVVSFHSVDIFLLYLTGRHV